MQAPNLYLLGAHLLPDGAVSGVMSGSAWGLLPDATVPAMGPAAPAIPGLLLATPQQPGPP